MGTGFCMVDNTDANCESKPSFSGIRESKQHLTGFNPHTWIGRHGNRHGQTHNLRVRCFQHKPQQIKRLWNMNAGDDITKKRGHLVQGRTLDHWQGQGGTWTRACTGVCTCTCGCTWKHVSQCPKKLTHANLVLSTHVPESDASLLVTAFRNASLHSVTSKQRIVARASIRLGCPQLEWPHQR